MSYKSIIQILLILAIISTICISIMKPKMHKPVIVYNSKLQVENNSGTAIDEKNIPVMVQNTQIAQNSNRVNIQNQNNTGVINQVQTTSGNLNNLHFSNNIPSQSQNINFSNTGASNGGFRNTNTGFKSYNIKPSNTKVTSNGAKARNVRTSNNGTKLDLNRIVQNNQRIINSPTDYDEPQQVTPQKNNNYSKPINQTKPSIRVNGGTNSSPVKIQSNTSSQPAAMTAQEEEIAWNKWRSNLNNQIMRDSKLPNMPNGIVFKYSFTVDKYGKVSNVQTSSATSGYTPYAIQFIAPVIRSYQGRAILNFPAGSRRVTTTVSGAWRISNTSKYSTPNDYHDIEKVKR